MNMLIRFFMLMTLIKREQQTNATSKRSSFDKQQPSIETTLAPFSRDYRILPHDMGFRNHLPNYRYLSFIELNITGWLTTTLHAIHGVKIESAQKLNWIISMQEMVYLKEIHLLNKLTVTSTIEGWDSKYIYFQHHFIVKGKVMAIGLTKFILVNKKGKQLPSELGLEGEKMTDIIDTWNANQNAIKAQ